MTCYLNNNNYENITARFEIYIKFPLWLRLLLHLVVRWQHHWVGPCSRPHKPHTLHSHLVGMGRGPHPWHHRLRGPLARQHMSGGHRHRGHVGSTSGGHVVAWGHVHSRGLGQAGGHRAWRSLHTASHKGILFLKKKKNNNNYSF